MAELVRLYSNLSCGGAQLRLVRFASAARRPAEGPKRPKQHHRRLSQAEVFELIRPMEQLSIKELAQRFGIHRVTVTALLRRTVWCCAGLASNVRKSLWPGACMFRMVASRLGERFGVDAATYGER